MAVKANEKMMSTILRDMTDGVLAVDNTGVIMYFNQAGANILGYSIVGITGKKYAEFMSDDTRNDDFHQFVLDAIYDKEVSHSGLVAYNSTNGTRLLKMTASFVLNEQRTENIGVSIVFSDVTEMERLSRLRHDASIIFSAIMSCITIYFFIWRATVDAGFNISPSNMTLVVEFMALIVLVIILKFTNFSMRDLNLKLSHPWKQLRFPLFICVGALAILAFIKMVILTLGITFFPEDAPFVDFGTITFSLVIYPFTVFLQEILARGMLQTSLRYVFTGKYAGFLAIIVSSLVFGAVHISHGIIYMLSAFVLLGVLGVYYEKTRNLWGVALIHYVMGVAVVLLRITG